MQNTVEFVLYRNIYIWRYFMEDGHRCGWSRMCPTLWLDSNVLYQTYQVRISPERDVVLCVLWSDHIHEQQQQLIQQLTTRPIDTYMVRCAHVCPFTPFKRNCSDLVLDWCSVGSMDALSFVIHRIYVVLPLQSCSQHLGVHFTIMYDYTLDNILSTSSALWIQ